MRSYRVDKILSAGMMFLLVGCFSTTNVTFTGSHIKPRAFGPGANSKLSDIKGKVRDIEKSYQIVNETSNKTLTVKTFTGFGADRPKFDLWTDKEGNIHFATAVTQENQAEAVAQVFRHLVWARMLSGAFESLADLLGSAFKDSQATKQLEIGADKDIKIEEIGAMTTE